MNAAAILRPELAADPRLAAGFTTRQFAPPDEPLDAVRARLARLEGFEAVASVGQVHGTGVAVVRAGGHVPAHDGLVTDVPGLLLTVLSADCALVLLADPDAGVVGACHSGWRGTVAKIAGETVRAMAALGAARVRAYVGPCISAEAFEVGEEVAAQFPDASVGRRPEGRPGPAARRGRGRSCRALRRLHGLRRRPVLFLPRRGRDDGPDARVRRGTLAVGAGEVG
jgi:hypothetical protein